MDNSDYNKKLQPFANNLRQNMTKAEACLWKYALSNRQMMGFQFRRQRPILKYIADFACLDLKLVIEVDGYSHQLEEVHLRDIEKDKALQSIGYSILRFSDNEILNHIQSVKEMIVNTIEEIQQSPPPTPASGGQCSE